MARIASEGKCSLCNKVFKKAAMTRHLNSCMASHSEEESSGGRRVKLLHLLVEGRYLPEYWMHVELSAKARFITVDDFLRRTWLECCGHMSAFRLPIDRHTPALMDGLGDSLMDAKLEEQLEVGTEFFHEYDMGTMTKLALQVVSCRQGKAKAGPIRLLARNDPPTIECACGKPAIQVCTQCVAAEGWLCDACASRHECGEEMLLPVVNSPRVGMCGYTG